ncbi:hypothetical protein BY458DRAFT_443748 [Sporodiniella umbellata]|nr:hypothetical protein BY458DRAFT_443748 [Sporodiniella umbellata]
MIGAVPKSPRLLDESWQRPLFPVTPTHSSTMKARKPDCACQHILVSKDSQHCALCDQRIPILSELHEEKDERRQALEVCQQALKVETDRAKTLEQDLTLLNKRCEETTQKLYERTERQNTLEKELAQLHLKYKQEQTESKKAHKAKADVENELEDLSQKLFEEANRMVAREKREKHQIETQLKHVQNELKSCREQMETEEMLLQELKKKMAEKKKRGPSLDNNSSDSNDDTSDTRSILSEEYSVEKKAAQDLTDLLQNKVRKEERVEPWVLQEFQDLVEAGESITIRKLHSLPYMKQSLVEDIEPCLRFGPHNRLSPKKLYEAMLLNTCFIEEAPYGFAQDQGKRPLEETLKVSAAKSMIWERLSSASHPIHSHWTGCQACGKETAQLPYRFKISMLDDWACVDRYCRDRLVSVCEFYTFIRNIRQGYYNGRSIPQLYQEAVRLKLQMFYARVGTLSQTLHSMGNKEDAIGHASGPNMIIPPVGRDDESSQSSRSNLSSNNSTSSLNESIQSQNQTRETLTENWTHPGNSVWKNL